MSWLESVGPSLPPGAGQPASGGAGSGDTRRSSFESFLSAAEEAAGAGYAVKLPVFEGPLDLLLHLIRLHEVDVTDIPIARIAEQYLEYLALLRELHLDVAAEYLVMAATLAWIKSRMLLPPDGASEEEEGPDPRAELVARLLEHERFKGAARELDALPLLGRDVFAAGAVPDAAPSGEPELEVSLFQLLEAFRQVLQQAKSAGLVHEVEVEPITVRERMIALMDVLGGGESAELLELLRAESGGPPTRALLVTTFLAMLELVRLAVLRIYQAVDESGAPSGPIRLRRGGEGAGERWSASVAEIT